MLQDILLLIVGAVLGFAGQVAWRQFEKRQERQSGPDVAVMREERDGLIYALLQNIGGDDIRELEVQAEWSADDRTHTQALNRFFRKDQNPVTESGSTIEYLGRNEQLFVNGVPQETPEAIVNIIVRGIGVRSHKVLHKESEIVVRRQK